MMMFDDALHEHYDALQNMMMLTEHDDASTTYFLLYMMMFDDALHEHNDALMMLYMNMMMLYINIFSASHDEIGNLTVLLHYLL